MKKITNKKSTPPMLAKKRTIGHPKNNAGKARANQQRRAQMPEYLREEHPELMLAEPFRRS